MRANLREAGAAALGEVDLVDREQAAGRVERAVANVDEVPEPVEEVGEVVEVALELDGDRDREVSGIGGAVAEGVICSKVMPLLSATWLSSSRIPDMSSWSGIAFVRR